jgi:hypothetical protein
MEPLNTSTDQRDPEAVLTQRQRSRSRAPLLLLASLLLTWLSAGYWDYLFVTIQFLGFVFLVLSIVCGILARQWIFVSAVVATIAGVAGLMAILILGRHGTPPEVSAVANLRTINTAEVTYLSASGGTYGSITELIAAGLLDETFIGTKAGYKYSITLNATGSVYTADVLPVSPNTGRFGYYSFPDAVVRYSTIASLAPKGQTGHYAQ